MSRKISHIGIAVKSIKESEGLYRDLLDLEFDGTETVEEQGVKVAFYIAGEVRIELLEPLSENSPVAKFIEKKGEGIHHVAFDSEDTEKEIQKFNDKGIRMIDNKPRNGAHHSIIAFVHPKSTSGVLLELCQKNES